MAIHTVVAQFDEYRDAESAIRDLEAAGIPSSDINLIANNAGNRYEELAASRLERLRRARRSLRHD